MGEHRADFEVWIETGDTQTNLQALCADHFREAVFATKYRSIWSVWRIPVSRSGPCEVKS